jgi:hypothetical protein
MIEPIRPIGVFESSSHEHITPVLVREFDLGVQFSTVTLRHYHHRSQDAFSVLVAGSDATQGALYFSNVIGKVEADSRFQPIGQPVWHGSKSASRTRFGMLSVPVIGGTSIRRPTD